MMMPSTDTAVRPDDALAALFQQHSRRVLSAAYRVTGSSQDAEDVLQTVFLRLARRQHRAGASGSGLDERAGSYLHKAGVNAAIDLLRARARAGVVSLDNWPNDPVDEVSVSPERQQRDREVRHRLRQALLEVPAKHAEIFALRFFEEMTNKEIATLLGVSQTAVGVSLFRTRRRLRGKLREFVGGDA